MEEKKVKKLLTTAQLEAANVNFEHKGMRIKSDNDAGAFVRLRFKDIVKKDASKNAYEGWKFHISLDESDRENIDKAWDVIIDVAMKYKLREMKFLHSDEPLTPQQSGKEITLYIDENDNPDLDWKEIINEVNSNLIKAGVKPGVRVFGDKPLKDSPYVNYRYDDPEEDYKSSVDSWFQPMPEEMIHAVDADPLFGMKVNDISLEPPKDRYTDAEEQLNYYNMFSKNENDNDNVEYFLNRISALDKDVSKLQDKINESEAKLVERCKDEDPRAKWGDRYATELLEKKAKNYKRLYDKSKQLSINVKYLEELIKDRNNVVNVIVDMKEQMEAGMDKAVANDLAGKVLAAYSKHLDSIAKLAENDDWIVEHKMNNDETNLLASIKEHGKISDDSKNAAKELKASLDEADNAIKAHKTHQANINNTTTVTQNLGKTF